MTKELEAMARGIRSEMGPVFGNPEYLAKPGNTERLEARQQRAADEYARAALLALRDAGPSEEVVECVTAAVAKEWENWNAGSCYSKEAPAIARAAITAYLNAIIGAGNE